MGIFMVNIQLPPASSLERTEGVVKQVENVLKRTDGIVACNGVGGLGILTNSFSPEFASFFCKLAPWDERKSDALHVAGIQQTLRRSLADIPGAVIFPFSPPTIPGFGAAGGFNFLLQDRSGTMSVAELGKQTQTFLDAARKRPELANLFTSFNAAGPAGGGGPGPGEGADPRSADQRRVRHLVDLDGRRLRQRLQPVRPALPGVRPGGAGVPSEARGHRPVLRPQPDHGTR